MWDFYRRRADPMERAVVIGRHVANRVAAADFARDVLADLKQPAGRLRQESFAAGRSGPPPEWTNIRTMPTLPAPPSFRNFIPET